MKQQRELFFNNIIDSILSIDLSKHVNSPETVNSVIFEDATISRSAKRFGYQFSGPDGHRFDVNIFEIKKYYFFRSFISTGSRYILSVRVVKNNSNRYSGETQIGRYYFDCSDGYKLERLRKAFKFFENRISIKKISEDENKFAELNSKIVVHVDKSITRDAKLDNILK